MRDPTAPASGSDPLADVRRAERLARGYGALVALTFGLIVLGALVRAHEAGLSCPDWPRCFGQWVPPMDMRVAFEWTHRLVAGGISVLFVVLGAVALGNRATRRVAGPPLAVAAALLAAQVVLGGLTVLLGLAAWTVTAHLLTGNAFAAALLVTALRLRDHAHPRLRSPAPRPVPAIAAAAGALLVAQLVLGGLVSSTYAGMACPEWPTCVGGQWFPSWRGSVGLHLAHRMNGYLLLLVLLLGARVSRGVPRVGRIVRGAAVLAIGQVAVGVANVRLGLPVEVTGLHSALAAALVLTVTAAVREAWARPAPVADQRPRVVIVGAGFGGLAAARALTGAPVDVLVLDRQNYHAFLPLLYQVAVAGLSAQDIVRPVRSILRGQPNVRFRMTEVVGGDLEAGVLETDDGDRIPFDRLILAAGSTTEFFGNSSIERHAFRLHHVEEALVLRNQVLECLERADAQDDPKQRESLLGFVVVGGGPTGVELAGMLAELRQHVLPREFPRIAGQMRVLLLEGRERLLPALSERLSARALDQVRELGVDVRLGAFVDSVDADGVLLRDGQHLRAQTVVWAAGIRGAGLAARLGLETGRGGRVPVDERLRVPAHPAVHVIGDQALVDGQESIPQVAPAAIQQGERVAENLARELLGAPPLPFRYRDLGTMATVGRNRAVAQVFGLELSGRPAWWAWLVVHLMKLVGFRNRIVVLVNWLYHYVTFDLGMRAIVGPRRRPSATGTRPPAPPR